MPVGDRAQERLAVVDPASAGWQRDLWVSCWRMARTAEQTGGGQRRPWVAQAV